MFVRQLVVIQFFAYLFTRSTNLVAKHKAISSTVEWENKQIKTAKLRTKEREEEQSIVINFSKINSEA